MSILKDLLVSNIELKVGSLLLAILLWFQIAGQPVQRTLLLPVEFVNIPSEMEITNDYEREVEVVIRARSTASFDERELAVVVDLRGIEPGVERSFPLNSERILNRPYDVDVLGFTPARIRLQLDRTIGKTIKVTPQLLGDPADGFEVTSVETQVVTVRGPESRVVNVNEVQAEPINIEGLSSSIVREVSMDTYGSGVRIDPPSTVIVITIEEEQEDKTINVPDSTPEQRMPSR
ncbi:MAG: CdaR family protein [Acidobacteriota bacterium]|nr:CdaR family protein [Acidobacteriota bacterium]